MTFIRKLLKNWLGFLSRWAIRKHDIKLVVVSGWYGTEATRELVYSILGSKYTVRRMTENPWWDFSIPLSILGYRDKRRNFFDWIRLSFKAFFRLTFGKANPHTLILNLNYADKETTRYWAGFVKPSILLVTNFKEGIEVLDETIRNTVENKGTVIYQYQDRKKIAPVLGKHSKVFTFGKESQADISYQGKDANEISFIYKKQTFRIKKGIMPGIKGDMLAGSLAVGAIKKVKPLDALYAMVKYPMSEKLLTRLKLDLLS